MLHIRNLSPVDIVVAPQEQIQEPPRRLSQESNLLSSARRMLFDKNAGNNVNASPNRVSSTPMVSIPGRKSRFFDNSISLCPSPIAKETNTQENGKHQQVQVADFEEQARERYDIPTTPVSRRSSIHSRNSRTPIKIAQKPSVPVKNCSVVIESMEIDPAFVTNYRRHQLSRLSVDSNVTDKNSVAMQETRIDHLKNRDTMNPEFDAVKEKLAQIHDDYTDDDSDVDDNIIVNIDQNSNINIPSSQEPIENIELEEIEIDIPETQENDKNSQEIRENSINRVVSSEAIESIRQLARRTTVGNVTEQTLGITLSTTTRPNAQNSKTSVETESYLKLTKTKGKITKKKTKSNENKKRTLYDEKSDDSDPRPEIVEEQQVPKDIQPTSSTSGVESDVSTTRITRQNTQNTEEVPNDGFLRPAPVKRNRGRPKTNREAVEIQSNERTTQKTASKRVADENSPPVDEPQEKRKKKNKETPAIIPSNEDHDEEDEGFDSDKNENAKSAEKDEDDVIYEPQNDRYGFRTRRVMKPYWIFTGTDQDQQLGYYFGFSKPDKKNKEEEKEKEKPWQNKFAVSGSKLFKFVEPKKIQKSSKSAKSKKSKTQKHRRIITNDASNNEVEPVEIPNPPREIATQQTQQIQVERRSMCMQTSFVADENVINQEIMQFDPLLQLRGLDVGQSITGNSIFSSSKFADISNIENIIFVECGNGLFFGHFNENESDGMIKIMPGGFKKRNRSKTSDIVSSMKFSNSRQILS